MASFFKRAKKAVKKVYRARLKIHAKVSKVAIPVVATAATIWLGPVAGAAVAGAGRAIQKPLLQKTYQWKGGMTDHQASQKARADANRTLKYAMMGVAAGAAGAGVYAAASGGNVLGGLLGGVSNVFGIGSQAAQMPVSGPMSRPGYNEFPNTFDPNGMPIGYQPGTSEFEHMGDFTPSTQSEIAAINSRMPTNSRVPTQQGGFDSATMQLLGVLGKALTPAPVDPTQQTNKNQEQPSPGNPWQSLIPTMDDINGGNDEKGKVMGMSPAIAALAAIAVLAFVL